MYFYSAFGPCISSKIQGMVKKDYFHCCGLEVCKLFFFLSFVLKRNSVICRVFFSQGKRKKGMSVTSLTFMSTACLLKGEKSPDIYGLMLKMFCPVKCGIIDTRGSHIVYRQSQ